MKTSKATQIGIALAAMFLLLLGVMTMNASASLPVAQQGRTANDKAVLE